MADLIEDLYRQNEWATLRLIEVCRGLTDEQLNASAIGSFGSIRETLTHLVGAEALNVHRMGGAIDSVPSRGGDWPGFERLEEVVRSAADALIERARLVGGTRIAVEEWGERVEIEANVILVQVLNHSTEHRGQICTILSALGALPVDGR